MNYFKNFYIEKMRFCLAFVSLSLLLCASDDDNNIKQHIVLENFYSQYKLSQTPENFNLLCNRNKEIQQLLNHKDEDNATILHTVIDHTIHAKTPEDKLFKNDVLQKFGLTFPLLLTEKKEMYAGNKKEQLSPFFYLLYQVKRDYEKNPHDKTKFIYGDVQTYKKQSFGETLKILSNYSDMNSLFLHNRFKKKKWWDGVRFKEEAEIIKEHIRPSQEKLLTVVKKILEKNSCLPVDLVTTGIPSTIFDEYNDCKYFFKNGIMDKTTCINIPIILNVLDNEYKEKILMLKSGGDNRTILDYCVKIPHWYHLLPKNNTFQQYYKNYIKNYITENKEDILTTLNSFYKHQLLYPEYFTTFPCITLNGKNYSIKDYIKNNIDFLLEKYRSLDVIDIFKIFQHDEDLFKQVCLNSISTQINNSNNKDKNYVYIAYQIISLFKYNLIDKDKKISIKTRTSKTSMSCERISLIQFLLEKQIEDAQIKQGLYDIMRDNKIKISLKEISIKTVSYFKKILQNNYIQHIDLAEFFEDLSDKKYTWSDLIEGQGIDVKKSELLEVLISDNSFFKKNNETCYALNIHNMLDVFDQETRNKFLYDTFLNNELLINFIFQKMNIEDARILIKKFGISIDYFIKNNIALPFDRLYQLRDLLDTEEKHNDFVMAFLQSLNRSDAPSLDAVYDAKNRRIYRWIQDFLIDNAEYLFSKNIDFTFMDLKFLLYLSNSTEIITKILNIITKNIDTLHDSSAWLIAHFFKHEIFKPRETPALFNGPTLLFSKFVNALALYKNPDFIKKISPVIVDVVKQNTFSLYDLTHEGFLYLKNILGNDYRKYICYTDFLAKLYYRQLWLEPIPTNDLNCALTSDFIDICVFHDAIPLKKFKRKNEINTMTTLFKEGWHVDLEKFLDIFDEEKRSEMLNYELSGKTTLLEYILHDAEEEIAIKILNKYSFKIPEKGFKKRKNSEEQRIKENFRLRNFLTLVLHNKDLLYSCALMNDPLFFKNNYITNWILDPHACFVFENRHPLLCVLDMIKNDISWADIAVWILPANREHAPIYTKFFEELINSSSASISDNLHVINKFCDDKLINLEEKVSLNGKEISIKDYVMKYFFDVEKDIDFSDKFLILFKQDQEFKDNCAEYIKKLFNQFPNKIPKNLFKFLEHDLIDIDMNISIGDTMSAYLKDNIISIDPNIQLTNKNISLFLCILNACDSFDFGWDSRALLKNASKLKQKFSISMANYSALRLINNSFYRHCILKIDKDSFHNYLNWHDFFDYITENTNYSWQNIISSGFYCLKNQHLKELIMEDVGILSWDEEKSRNNKICYTLNVIELLENLSDETRNYLLKSKINNVTLSNFILTEFDRGETYKILKKYPLSFERVHFKADRLVTFLQHDDILPGNLNFLLTSFFKQICFDISTRFSLKYSLEKNENLRKVFFRWFCDDNTLFFHEGKLHKPIEILMEHSDDFSFLYDAFSPDKKDLYYKRIKSKITKTKEQLGEHELLNAHKNALEEIENFYKNNLIDLSENIDQDETILNYACNAIHNINVGCYSVKNLTRLNTVDEVKNAYLLGIQGAMNHRENNSNIQILETITRYAHYGIINTDILIKTQCKPGKKSNTVERQLLSHLINEAAKLGTTNQESNIKQNACDVIRNIFVRNEDPSKLDNLTPEGERLLKTYDKDYKRYCVKKPSLIFRHKKHLSLLLLAVAFLLYRKWHEVKKLVIDVNNAIYSIL